MKITREVLNSMYLEYVEEEKKRLEKLLEDETNSMLTEILNENRKGKKVFEKIFFGYQMEYFNILMNKMQEILVDSKITTGITCANTEDNKQDGILVTIDWSI
jgi:hypothetical protein